MTAPPRPSDPRRLVVLAAAFVLGAPCASRAAAQSVDGPLDTAVVVADSSDLVGAGRAAQAGFERRRHRLLPVTLGFGGGGCDENVGRFCTWYGEGEWYPQPEREEIVALRAGLLAELDSLQALVPGDGWLMGQRVWYRAEAGDWRAALGTARDCDRVEPWWCAALRGFALHGLGRSAEALGAFEEALELMDPERAREWRRPLRAVDSDARDLLERLDEMPEDSAELVVDRLWTLADPLYLVAGNDRESAHYARWTVSHLRERARNPFRIGWGNDLEELTVRHGWEMGWERSPPRVRSTQDNVIGHKHPEGRDYMPPGAALLDPSEATDDDLRPDKSRPRSLYAPDYAPVLLPMRGQLAVFPRGEETVFVSTHFLPADTTFHAEHGHALPWLEPGDQERLPDRIGLFAVPVDEGRPGRRTATGRVEGALMLTVPTGGYVLSSESWSPSLRRAGRMRVGVPARPAPADIATLSDVLLLRPAADEPTSLETAVVDALPRPEILPGQTFAIGWEVAGLGFRAETLRYEVSVTDDGGGVLRRIGQFLGLADRPQPLVLSWEEPGPEEPGHRFRYLELDLPPLDEGRYHIRLALATPNRSPAVTETTFEVRRREP